jgi:hypothetical protein
MKTTSEKFFALALDHKIEVGREVNTGAWYIVHPKTQEKHYAGTQAECYEQLQLVIAEKKSPNDV